MVTCNMLSAMKQSEKPSGCHKNRREGLKTKQKIRLVCKVCGAFAAIRLFVVCQSSQKKAYET